MEHFMKERFDYKRFFLLNTKRIWIVVACVIIMAALFGGVYYINEAVLNSETTYRIDTIYNIEFDKDLYGDTIQYYNDFTWNDVIDSDIIGGVAAKIAGVDADKIYNATFVPTMSDIRLIHVYIDSKDINEAKLMEGALTEAIESFGKSTDGFVAIDKWSDTEAFAVKKDFLIGRVTVIGAILGLLLGISLLCYVNAMDDSVYTLNDAKCFTGVTAIGYIYDGMSDDEKNALTALIKKNAQASVIHLGDGNIDSAKEILNAAGITEYEESADTVTEAKEVILLIEYGKHDGCKINATVEKLNYLGVNIKASIITNADKTFIRKYY